MRKLAILLAALVALTVVPPAFGGPSPLAIAKKALRVAEHAQDAADAGPRIQYVAASATAPRLGFARITTACPQGYLATGIQQNAGALEPVYAASYGRGAIASMWNPSKTTAHKGAIQITCVRGKLDRQPQPSAADLTRDLAAAESERLALLGE